MRLPKIKREAPLSLVRRVVTDVLCLYLAGHLLEIWAVYTEDGQLTGRVIGPSPLGLPALCWGVIVGVWAWRRKYVPNKQFIVWTLASITPIFLQLFVPWTGATPSLRAWYINWVPDSLGIMLLTFLAGIVLARLAAGSTDGTDDESKALDEE